MKRAISHGQAMRSTLGRARVIHFIAGPPASSKRSFVPPWRGRANEEESLDAGGVLRWRGVCLVSPRHSIGASERARQRCARTLERRADALGHLAVVLDHAAEVTPEARSARSTKGQRRWRVVLCTRIGVPRLHV